VKLATLLLCVLCLVACAKKMQGRVMEDLRVDWGEGVSGSCVFDNTPHVGDKVTVADDGRCHATPQ
jgi:hypothetical protein